MKFTFTEKRMDSSEDLRAYAIKKISKLDRLFKTEAEAKAFTGAAKTTTKNPGTAAQTADPIALVVLAAAASAGLAFAASKKH